MRHQECFALMPNTDGMIDLLRKVFMANVDDVYRLADKYAETHEISVQVRETASRGYYLSVPPDLASGWTCRRYSYSPRRIGRSSIARWKR